MQLDPLEQAFEFYKTGQPEAAVHVYRALLTDDPGNAEANHMIGVIAFQQGKQEIARDFMRRATECTGVTAEMFNNLGSVLNALGDMEGACSAYEQALELKPDYADALNNIGVIHRNAKRIAKAIEALRRAVQLNPDHGHAKANLKAAYRDVVPGWHFAMMGDRARNDAYEAAIRRAVPGKKVLDIGTGAGLLTLMAARAGALRVTGCETVSIIAERARMIVEQNGFGERATIWPRPSQELAVGRELPERADVLVTETFSSGLINEDVIPTIEHAHEYLLTPNAVVIPRAGSAMGYLVGGEHLKDFLFVDKVSGFDLSLFDDFSPPNMQMTLDRFPHEIYSDDIELYRFNLMDRSFPMDKREHRVRVTRAGICLGVAQWIRLELDATTRYENRPGPNAPFTGHWSHVLYRFQKPLPVSPGDIVNLTVKNYRTQITVERTEETSPY